MQLLHIVAACTCRMDMLASQNWVPGGDIKSHLSVSHGSSVAGVPIRLHQQNNSWLCDARARDRLESCMQ